MRVVRIPAFAKVNLSLDILGKRPDGYHELRTVYQTVSLHDDLTFRPYPGRRIHLEIRGDPALQREAPERNLAYRAADVYPLPDIPRRSILVVSPSGISISTADAYRWLGLQLTKRPNPSTLWKFCALCWSSQGSGVSNDFERAVFRRIPRLAAIKREMLRRGAAEAALAGSGSAVFGVFRNPAQARRAAQGFLKDQTFVCETLSRERYRGALNLRAVV